jgi:positive regulator of sigma E activity
MEKSDYHGTIQHDGKVKKVESNSVLVSIASSPACSGCQAEGLCGISGKEEIIVDVKGRYNVSPGDMVTILMEQKTGYKAVVLSYLVPLVIFISGLILFNLLSFKELISGLVSISLLFPYFLVLYLFRNKINRNIIFTLKT